MWLHHTLRKMRLLQRESILNQQTMLLRCSGGYLKQRLNPRMKLSCIMSFLKICSLPILDNRLMTSNRISLMNSGGVGTSCE